MRKKTKTKKKTLNQSVIGRLVNRFSVVEIQETSGNRGRGSGGIGCYRENVICWCYLYGIFFFIELRHYQLKFRGFLAFIFLLHSKL